jgi:hypothetical protein
MKSKNILLVFILMIFITSFLFVVKKCSELPVEVIAGKIEAVKDKNGNTHFIKPIQNNSSEISKKEVDSLKNIIAGKNTELNLKNIEISSITKMNMSIKDTLRIVKLEKDDLNNKIWKFEKIYKDGTKTKVVMYEKDTTVIQETDLKLYVTDFSAKENGKKTYYVDVTSQNKNFKLNGSEVLRIPIKQPKDLLRINWSSDYSRGVGNDINFATSEINLQLLPDGVIVPKLGSGVIWFMNEGRFYPYYKIGVDIKLKSINK